MNTFVRKFYLVLALSSIFTSNLFSLSSDMLSRKFEERARKALERFVPAKEFQVSVAVTAKKEDKAKLPYDPGGARGSLLESSTVEELNQYVESVKLELLISKRLNSTKAKLVDILFKELRMDGGRGDKISFGTLGIELAPEAWEKERVDYKRQVEALESEKEKLNRDLIALKMENQQALAREPAKNEQPQKIQEVEKTDPFWKDFVSENAKYFQFLSLVIVFACLSVIGLLAMAARSAYSTRKKLAEGFTTVAGAMSTIAGAIGSSAYKKDVTGGGQSLIEAKFQGQLPSGSSPSSSGGSGYTLRNMHQHIVQRQKEVLEALNPQTEAVLIQYIMNVASNPLSVSKAAVALELLGQEKASEIFNQLGVHTQELVSQFFRTGQFEKSKHELMLDVIEELKTKFLAVTLQSANSPRDEKLANKIYQLADDDLINLFLNLDAQALPRLFLYMEAKKISHILHQLKSADPTRFTIYIKAVAIMSEYQTKFELDEVLEEAVDNVRESTRTDKERPFLKRYQEIVENADEELTEQLIRQLPKNGRVLDYLNTHAVTIHTLFLLKPDAKLSILRDLSNEEIASLCYHFGDKRKEIISLFVPKRREAIVQQLEAIAGRGDGQLEELYEKSKIAILTELKTIQRQGILAENLDSDIEEEIDSESDGEAA